ncbi:MAG: hypothetical protein D6681_16285 [Calditrichaeota bacterium]|nr:MAG: hypothetical protein D6681_16285 [Calditrichota bacterium]
MKSPYFTEEHKLFRQSVREFVEREIAPHVDAWEAEERIPREIWRKMGAQGLLGIGYPETVGGTEADFFYSVVLLEELARGGAAGFAAAVAVHVYVALTYLHRFGSPELQEAYLRPGIAGEKIGALAITEPNTGSNVAAIRTRAVQEGDHYRLNGAKTFITNGVYGDFLIVAARTDAGDGPEGISLLVVDRRAPGVEARPLKKIGWHCSDTAEISFDDVRVPVSRLLGEAHQGFYYLMDCFQLERLAAAILAVAGAEVCLEETLRYITKREAFDRPLATFQVIRHALADLSTEIEAARQLTYHAAWRYDQGEPAVRECTMAKLYATELARKTADTCLQYFGGYGYMAEYPISRMFRDARVGTIVGGASEIMREILARIVVEGREFERSGRDRREAIEENRMPETASSPVESEHPETPPAAEAASPPEEITSPAESEHPEIPPAAEAAASPAEQTASPETPEAQSSPDDELESFTAQLEALLTERREPEAPAPGETLTSFQTGASPKNVSTNGENLAPEEEPTLSDDMLHSGDNSAVSSPSIVPRPQVDKGLLDSVQKARREESVTPPNPEEAASEEHRSVPEAEFSASDRIREKAPRGGLLHQLKKRIIGRRKNHTSPPEEPEAPPATEAPSASSGEPETPPATEEASPEPTPAASSPEAASASETPPASGASPSADPETPSVPSEEDQPSAPEEGDGSHREAFALPENPTAEDILFSLPRRFRPDKAGDYRGVFHFKIRGRAGGEFTVHIEAGACRVEKGLQGVPRCVIETADRTYLDIELGKTSPQVAFMMGKVKVSNVPEMMQFTKFFNKLPDT